MTVKEITNYFETFAPLSVQESYDNAGLIVGNPQQELTGVLIAFDVTEETVNEAITKKANLIIAHHPIVFKGLKTITGKNYIERIIINSIKHDIAIYASHTNLDSVIGGINSRFSEKMGLENCRILAPVSQQLKKLVTFVPKKHIEQVQKAVFEAGAGHIGEYDQCSFRQEGQGTFRASENTKPFVGKKGELHVEEEIRFETIFPKFRQKNILQALIENHPYEEVAYDVYSLDNQYDKLGIGMIGYLPKAMLEMDFLHFLKEKFRADGIKYTKLRNKPIRTVAVCGGSGSFLLKKAMAARADVFVSADFKYHDFFDAENQILIADIGHYESEEFAKEIFYEVLMKKFPNFAFYISEINSNPVNYL